VTFEDYLRCVLHSQWHRFEAPLVSVIRFTLVPCPAMHRPVVYLRVRKIVQE
jgi:hypothetical protein